MNADTNCEQERPVVVDRVLRDIIWRIVYPHGRFGPRERVVLSKIDVTEVFGQVSMQRGGAPVFGYGFCEWVLGRLQFGWRSSPGFFYLFSVALIDACRTTTP